MLYCLVVPPESETMLSVFQVFPVWDLFVVVANVEIRATQLTLP